MAMAHKGKCTCKNMKETQDSTVNSSRQDDHMLEFIDAKTPEGQRNGHFKQQMDCNMWVTGGLRESWLISFCLQAVVLMLNQRIWKLLNVR